MAPRSGRASLPNFLGFDMGKELTPENIMHLGLSFWGSKTLLSAIELGLFTELAKKPLEADTVRDRLKLHPRSVRDFLDALVALHMLERDADGKYRNASETNLFLDRAKPSYARVPRNARRTFGRPRFHGRGDQITFSF